MRILTIAMLAAALTITGAKAAERRPISEVNPDAITSDTQTSAKEAGADHAAIVWWIPQEFWQAITAKDDTTDEADKQLMLDAMSGISLLAVVQADISDLGAFDYYSKDEVEENLVIYFTGEDGKKKRLRPLREINPDLEVLLNAFKPILGAAMGNLGSNMHFYVLRDRTASDERLIDPYEKGQLDVQLAKRGGELMTAGIELPLNSLYIPRKCPNGKDAHISWKFCPWTGEPLEE